LITIGIGRANMIGPIVNGFGIITGSLMGALLGDKIHENLRTRLPLVFGCASMGLGVSMIVKAQTMPAVVLTLLFGTILGELLNIEAGIQHLAGKSRTLMERFFSPPDTGITKEEFMERFVSMIVLFSVSGMGVFGAMKEGMSGDPSLLYTKTILDFFTAIIFATSLGMTLALASIPQFLVQASLFLAAAFIMPLTNEVMIADFSAAGGFLMLATGFRICGIVSFPISNMIPSLFLAMPLSALWNYLIQV